MGKPRMIILIRHAQSEGNRNRNIHQYIPDHRVELTPEGKLQAREAGRRLREMLQPDDTIRFLTSPYRRTRDTTGGMLETLTEEGSPFKRDDITVYEEPRLREQDFGNFQPCSAEMSRMWHERAAYGHFFYRIPNGESAADAYDRVSGFNESLWRQFGDEDFPSVCVLVTHGLMTRVFLMKWYHWTVEEFEDLRNVNHCEFIVMRLKSETGKYSLENKMRTWSELQGSVPTSELSDSSPVERWKLGGCAGGCNHRDPYKSRHSQLKELADQEDQKSLLEGSSLAGSSCSSPTKHHSRQASVSKGELSPQFTDNGFTDDEMMRRRPTTQAGSDRRFRPHHHHHNHKDGAKYGSMAPPTCEHYRETPGLGLHHIGRDFGGSYSGHGSPEVGSQERRESIEDDCAVVPDEAEAGKEGKKESSRPSVNRLLSVAEMVELSGMNSDARAERLGDGRSESGSE